MKTQVILRNLQWLGRHNPAFTPGSVQTAVAELLNPTSSILPYSAHLLIGRPTVAGSGRNYFNIDAGATKNVNFSLAMPTAEGTYPVYLDIFSNDQLLEDYRATEDVTIRTTEGYSMPVSIAPSSGGSVKRSPDKPSYEYGEMVDITAIANPGWSFDRFTGIRADGSSWVSHANPVHLRAGYSHSVIAHFV
ncbi:hypothetical protein ES703_120961 [subsurface metagenome]